MLPTYKYVLDNVPRVQHILKRIKERSIDHDLVFLDYNTNTDVRDISQPLSHAGLVKLYIEDRYPEYDPSIRPMTKEEVEDKRQRQKEEKKARTTKHKRNSSTDNRPGNDSTCSSSDKNDFQEELFPSSFFESK